MNIREFVDNVKAEYADYAQKWRTLSGNKEDHFLTHRAEVIEMAARLLELQFKDYKPDTAYWDNQHSNTRCSECGCDALEKNGREYLSRCCPACGRIMIIKDTMDWVPCSECISFDECENKENCDGCYAGEREEEVDE